jgi:hypothetical protein
MKALIDQNEILRNAKLLEQELERKTIIDLNEKEFAFDIFVFEIKRGGFFAEFKGFYMEGIRKFFIDKGFRKKVHSDGFNLVQEIKGVVEVVEIIRLKETLFDYISSNKQQLIVSHRNITVAVGVAYLVEAFLKRQHLLINATTVELLPNLSKSFLRDQEGEAFLVFDNKIIKVNAGGVCAFPHGSLEDICIWKEQIINKRFAYTSQGSTCHFSRFIDNLANHEPERVKAFKSSIGYLLHNYSKSSNRKAVIFYDEELSDADSPQGGTGKSLFANAIKKCRKTVRIDGKAFDAKDQFCFQDVNEDTQVVWIDDNRADFDFQRLNSIITEGLIGRRLFKGNFHLSPETGPKYLICSNTIVNNRGKTAKRRQFIVEFSNHYSRQVITGLEEPIIEEHGVEFFNWGEEEDLAFYSFMIDCLQFYFQHGLCNYQKVGVEANQINQELGREFYEWISKKTLPYNERLIIKDLYLEFWTGYLDSDPHFTQKKFTSMLKKYCDIIGVKHERKASNGVCFFTIEEPKN